MKVNIPKGPVTNFLVAANVVIWLILQISGLLNAAIANYGFYPALMQAALTSGDIADISLTAFVHPLTSAFLHGNFMHIVMNVLMLLFTGRFVENALGARGMFVLYGASLYAAAYAEYAMNAGTSVNMVGASGASSGVLAAYMLLYARSSAKGFGPIAPSVVRRVQLFALWVGINLALDFLGAVDGNNVAIWAHIGGFAAGLLFTRPILNMRFRH